MTLIRVRVHGPIAPSSVFAGFTQNWPGEATDYPAGEVGARKCPAMTFARAARSASTAPAPPKASCSGRLLAAGFVAGALTSPRPRHLLRLHHPHHLRSSLRLRPLHR